MIPCSCSSKSSKKSPWKKKLGDTLIMLSKKYPSLSPSTANWKRPCLSSNLRNSRKEATNHLPQHITNTFLLLFGFSSLIVKILFWGNRENCFPIPICSLISFQLCLYWCGTILGLKSLKTKSMKTAVKKKLN